MKKKERKKFGNVTEYCLWMNKQSIRYDNYSNGCFWCFCFACFGALVHWLIPVVITPLTLWCGIKCHKIIKEMEDAQEEWRNRK